MKIKSLCDLYYVYLAIEEFYLDSGLYSRPDLGPDVTADNFFISLSTLNDTLAMWKKVPGSDGLFKCSIK